jgi:DNA-binding phage protein
MGLQGLLDYFEKTYEYLNMINASKDGSKNVSTIHPLIKTNVGMILNLILKSKSRKLAIVLPNKQDISIWITLLAGLGLIQNEYKSKDVKNLKFHKGQRLLIGKCIVEYVEDVIINKKPYIKVKCAGEGSFYSLPMELQLYYQPTNSEKRLSSMEKVSAVYSKLRRQVSQVDKILDIDTKGNKALFSNQIMLLSKINDVDNLLREHSINGKKITELLHIGKINYDGQCTSIGNGKVDANPVCVVASDIYGAASYLGKNNESIKAIIVDGVSRFIKDMQMFDDEMMSDDIPVIVVTDVGEKEDLFHLIDRGFEVWNWDTVKISGGKFVRNEDNKSPFNRLNNTLRVYSNQLKKKELCRHEKLSEVIMSLTDLDRKVDPEDDNLKEILKHIYRAVNNLSRLIYSPDAALMDILLKEILNLREKYFFYSIYVEKEIDKQLSSILKELEGIVSNPVNSDGHKIRVVNRLLSEKQTKDRYVFIVQNERDEINAKEYWKKKFGGLKMDNVQFLTLGSLLSKPEGYDLDLVIVCGWLGGYNMNKLMNHHIGKELVLLFYPHENIWHLNIQAKNNRIDQQINRNIDFAAVFALDKEHINIVGIKEDKESKEDIVEYEEMPDFEYKIREYSYSKYINKGINAVETQKAKLVTFTQGKFAFLTKNHRLIVINDLLKGNKANKDISRRSIDDIRIGDFVLFKETDKDLIKEIAESKLEEQGLGHIKRDTGLWREALIKAYKEANENINTLVAIFHKAGCTRHLLTIKKWINDEDVIGPQDENDLQYIAKVAKYQEFNRKLDAVRSAISVMRSCRHAASDYITDRLLRYLPEIIKQEKINTESNNKSMMIDLDNFGKVYILRIEDISKDYLDIETKDINQLFEEEDEQQWLG